MPPQVDTIIGSWASLDSYIHSDPPDSVTHSTGLTKERIFLELENEIPDEMAFIPCVLLREGGESPPISIMLEKFEAGNWIASFAEQQSIFAEGKTEEGAVLNLAQSAAEDYRILLANEDELAPHLAEELKVLSRFFGE